MSINEPIQKGIPQNYIDDIQKQVVKEFAEKLKEKSYVNDYCREVVEIGKIDELLKEYEK